MGGVLAMTVAILAGLQSPGVSSPVVQAPTGARLAPRCLKALAPVLTDAIPLSREFVPADCPVGRLAAAFRYDTGQHSSRVIRNIAGNEIVSSYPEFGAMKIMPGESLVLVATYGPVRVERAVRAMQAARPRQRLFVKAQDGQVISVRYEAGAR